MLTGSHRFNIKSTNWWVNWWVKRISGVKMVGRDNVVREDVLSDCGGYKGGYLDIILVLGGYAKSNFWISIIGVVVDQSISNLLIDK